MWIDSLEAGEKFTPLVTPKDLTSREAGLKYPKSPRIGSSHAMRATLPDL
jgi:hypothetical protein